MEDTPAERVAEVPKSMSLGILAPDDTIVVTTRSGSNYTFTVTEIVQPEDYPDQSFVASHAVRQSDHGLTGDFESSIEDPAGAMVRLEGSCDGAILWGTAAIRAGGDFDIVVGKGLGFRDTKGNLIVTSKVVDFEVTKPQSRQRLLDKQ